MGLSTYATDSAGAYSFVGLGNFVTLLTDSLWSKPFWNAAKNNLIFFLVHMAVQNPIGSRLPAFSACRPQAEGPLSHHHLPADDAFRGHRRLFLEFDPLPAVGRRRRRAQVGRARESLRALARPSVNRARDPGADLRVAVRRDSADADLCGASQHSRRARRRGAGRRPRALAHIPAHQAAARAAHHRPRLDPHLRRELQRLRPHLLGQGRPRRTQFRFRHSRHLFLPHLLRQPAAARQSDHGRGGRDRDVLHHPGGVCLYLFIVQRRLRRYAF